MKLEIDTDENLDAIIHKVIMARNKPDPYAALKEAFARDGFILVRNLHGKWFKQHHVSWNCPPERYVAHDKNYDQKKAFARGEQIQVEAHFEPGLWVDIDDPCWGPTFTYRIAPKEPTLEDICAEFIEKIKAVK